MTKRAKAGNAMRQVLFLVFMLTGATSLIFQVVWTRLLLLSIGTTPTAMSVVLAAFMGGWRWAASRRAGG